MAKVKGQGIIVEFDPSDKEIALVTLKYLEEIGLIQFNRSIKLKTNKKEN